MHSLCKQIRLKVKPLHAKYHLYLCDSMPYKFPFALSRILRWITYVCACILHRDRQLTSIWLASILSLRFFSFFFNNKNFPHSSCLFEKLNALKNEVSFFICQNACERSKANTYDIQKPNNIKTIIVWVLKYFHNCTCRSFEFIRIQMDFVVNWVSLWCVSLDSCNDACELLNRIQISIVWWTFNRFIHKVWIALTRNKLRSEFNFYNVRFPRNVCFILVLFCSDRGALFINAHNNYVWKWIFECRTPNLHQKAFDKSNEN